MPVRVDLARPYDEAFADGSLPRPAYAEALAALQRRGVARCAEAATRAAARTGFALGDGDSSRPLPVDPVPRILTREEWARLAAGLAQRARALDALVADAYGARRSVAEGLLPEAALSSSHYFEPGLVGAAPPPMSVGVAGFDVARREDGELVVLEDNLLTPGHAAVPAARELLGLWRHVPSPPREMHGAFRAAFAGMLAATGADPGRAAILADHGGERASWEVRWLGAFLDLPVLGLEDVRARSGRLEAREGGRVVEAIWQRTSEDRLRDDAGRPTGLGERLETALLTGALRVVNRIGCGIADKRVMRYGDALIRGLLGEEPLLETPASLDLARPEEREQAFSRPEAWVFKPRAGAGGRGVALGAVPRAARRDPAGWIAQERVRLSVHPTAAGDALEPRAVDLRAFAFRRPDGGYAVPPGGVSRYAPWSGGGIVNTSSGGGVKDVWVL